MRRRFVLGCALVLAASSADFAEDRFEPNPSLAELSADDAYSRESARSLRTADINTPVAFRLDDAGRVLVVGASYVWGNWSLGFPRVARLDAVGRLDASFGDGGVAEIPVWGSSSLGIEVDATGRIVVAGDLYEAYSHPWESGDDGLLYGAARLLSDGSLDPAFSGDGLLELDRATGPGVVGPVRAAGSDGAMLAVAAKASRYAWQPLVVGVVRIAADGTLDATYGGGFAQVTDVQWAGDDIDSVTDFAVDSAGRAVVALLGRYGYGMVQRLDAAGGVDPSYWGYDPYSLGPTFRSTRIALDGAGRIVGLDGGLLQRRLPDGAPDPAFSGDGFAWGLEVAGFPGSLRAYAELQSRMRADPNYDPYPETAFLAVATSADRWVLAKPVTTYDAKGRRVGGIRVQAIDPADPGAIVSTIVRAPGLRFTGLAGLAVTPDGATAYALGTESVLRVDLTARKPLPLPDLRVNWLGWPHAVHLGGDRFRVTAKVRIRNVSRHDATAAYGFVGLGDGGDEIPLVGPAANGSGYSWPFRVRGHSSVVKRFSWEGKSRPVGLAGARLSIRVASDLPDANLGDNTATSRQMTPLYAPR